MFQPWYVLGSTALVSFLSGSSSAHLIWIRPHLSSRLLGFDLSPYWCLPLAECLPGFGIPPSSRSLAAPVGCVSTCASFPSCFKSDTSFTQKTPPVDLAHVRTHNKDFSLLFGKYIKSHLLPRVIAAATCLAGGRTTTELINFVSSSFWVPAFWVHQSLVNPDN